MSINFLALAFLMSLVDVVHACNVVHFDLKPANILLDENLEPVICDFGIANIVGGESRLAAGLDNPNLVGLTTTYASPVSAMKVIAFICNHCDTDSY